MDVVKVPAQLDQEAITRLVDRFYDKVQVDAVIGPVFNAAVDDWDAHKALLVSFWCSVVLRAASYRGNPMGMHRGHPIRAEHFDHWLELWQATANEVLDAPSAAVMCEYAQRIGRGLRMGLGLADPPRGRALDLPVLGERLR